MQTCRNQVDRATSIEKRLVVAVLLTPEVMASSACGIYDMFASAGLDRTALDSGKRDRCDRALASPVFVARAAQPLQVCNGVWLQPERDFLNCPLPDIVFVPELCESADTAKVHSIRNECDWLCECHARGATLVSASSATRVLAETGLLDGHEATTHRACCKAMTSRYPKIDLQPDRSLVTSGEAQRLITSGGVASYLDVGLFLIARFLGTREAMQVADSWQIDWHRDNQAPFASLTRAAQTADGRIAAMQEWIAENYDQPSPVTELVEQSGLPMRTCKRRFKEATGLSPLDYIQLIRLEEAKRMLEESARPVEDIAADVGYEDDSFFRIF